MNAVPLTLVDVVQHMLAALVYIAVAVAALGEAPRDRRTQVFFALGLANVLAFGAIVVAWFLGMKSPQAMNRPWLGVSLSALGLGGLLLFHFSQVFPRKRPWIKESGIQMPVAYVLTPVVILSLAAFWADDPAKITAPFAMAMLIFGFPLMILLAFVLPVAAILSLIRSYREAAAASGIPDARPVLGAILLSQIAGGLLAIIVAPVLNVTAPDSLALKLLTMVIWALSLLTPLAFAAGVWKYRLLEIDPG